jgi:hypothetical protein
MATNLNTLLINNIAAIIMPETINGTTLSKGAKRIIPLSIKSRIAIANHVL